MNATARLLAHAAAFAALVAWLRPGGVTAAALITVFALGVVFLLLAPRHRRYSRSVRVWTTTLVYASLLAALFAGADFALQALGNSVKSRTPLPQWLGGLELYWLLVPGVASVAVGALAGLLTERPDPKRAS